MTNRNIGKINIGNVHFLIILFFGCFSQTVFSQLPTYLPADSLVGWWPFNGNANDESGNGNNGTVNGATLNADRFGNLDKAYSFNGTSDFIQTNLVGPTGNSSRTVSYWMNSSSIQQYMTVLGYGNNTSINDFHIWHNWACDGVNINVSNAAITYSTGQLDNNWHNYIFVFDNLIGDSINDVKIYHNGLLLSNICSSYGHGNIFTGNIYPISIGKYHATSEHFFNGSLDDIAIWNRALSPSEVYNLYQANCTLSVTIQSPPAVAGCEGDTVPLSANANASCQYQWYKDGQILPSATDSVLLASGSGWYTVKAISSFCESKDSVQIIQFPLPEVNAGSDQTICLGSSIILNGSGTTTYSWNNGVQDGIAFVPNGNMNYVLTGTDSNGCISSDIVNVTVLGAYATFMVQVDSDGGQCNGVAAVNMNYDSGFLFNWSNGYTSTGMVGMIDSCYALCPGPVSVIVSDNTNNCEFSFSGVIGDNSPGGTPLTGYLNLVNSNSNSPCNGEANVLVYGGLPPYQYQFLGGNGIIADFSNTADSLCPGVYTFKVLDSQQDSLNIAFLICDSSSIFSNTNPAYQDSVILDTLVVSVIENCEIDFASVDSVWISSYSYLGTDSLLVIWNIQDSSGIHEILNYYNISNCQGVFNLELSIFCPQKSTDNPYLKAYYELYIDPQSAGINQLNNECIKVWPNPFRDQLNIELSINQQAEYFVMDNLGRIAVKGRLVPGKQEIDLKELTRGVYFLRVGENNIKVEKW